jgi:hypothetical protein
MKGVSGADKDKREDLRNKVMKTFGSVKGEGGFSNI